MERVTLDRDLGLGRRVHGMWRLGGHAETSPGHVQAKIEACLAQGIASLGQTGICGSHAAEAIPGEALRAAPRLRDRAEIAALDRQSRIAPHSLALGREVA